MIASGGGSLAADPPTPLSTSQPPRGPSRRTVRILLGLGWALLAAFVLRSASLKHIGADVRGFQVAYLVGFAGYVVLIWVVTRCGDDAFLGRWRWWLVGCIAVRAVLLGMGPSDDAYRYAWEGRVQLAGFNPYRHAPTDEKLAHLRDDDWWRINHPDSPAIYPPVAQAEFLALAATSPTVHTAKVLHTVWDVLVVAILGMCLRKLGRRPHAAIIYGLCPLVLTAFAIEGHLDSLMLLFAAAALWSTISNRLHIAGVMLGMAIAAKLVLAVLLPWFVIRHPRTAAIALTVAALTCLPYLSGGATATTSVQGFAVAGDFFSMPGTLGIVPYGSVVSHIVVAIVLGAVLLILAWRVGDITAYCRAATGATLMLMPIVHFWYVSSVLMFLPFGLRLRWLVVSLALVTYFEALRNVAITGTWSMPSWAPVVVWTSFLVTWPLDHLLCRRYASNSERRQ